MEKQKVKEVRQDRNGTWVLLTWGTIFSGFVWIESVVEESKHSNERTLPVRDAICQLFEKSIFILGAFYSKLFGPSPSTAFQAYISLLGIPEKKRLRIPKKEDWLCSCFHFLYFFGLKKKRNFQIHGKIAWEIRVGKRRKQKKPLSFSAIHFGFALEGDEDRYFELVPFCMNYSFPPNCFAVYLPPIIFCEGVF